jgi:hypothetical protein
MFCRVARVRSAAERSFEAHKIWLSNSNERTEGHVVSLSRKGVHFDAVVTHVFPCKLMCSCVVLTDRAVEDTIPVSLISSLSKDRDDRIPRHIEPDSVFELRHVKKNGSLVSRTWVVFERLCSRYTIFYHSLENHSNTSENI